MEFCVFLLGFLSSAQAIGSSPNIPILPISLEVKDVPQYFRLQRAAPGEESVPTSHGNVAQSHSETFIVTRLGSREPHVRASYQHLQVQENVPWNKLGARVRGVQVELVGDEVSPSDPVTRVLFHRSGVDSQARGSQNTCVNVQGTYDGLNVEGSCRIQLPLDVCVVELLFSPSWFSLSTLPLNVTLNYTVSDDCKGKGEVSEVAGTVSVVNVGTPRIQQVSVGDSVTISLPDKTLLPGEVFTASITLRHNWTQPSFSLRVRCRTGLELLFARSAVPNAWAVKTEMQKGAKHHTVIGHVTHRGASERRPLPAVAHLDFLVSNISVGSAVSRRITFQLEVPGSSAAAAAAGVRGSAEVLVSDRDLRAILPMVKSHEILNTAPLTGISQKIPVRVLAIEAGGSVLDVTKQAGCETPNAQIVQVSDGCDFLFVGGKETQGALGVKVEFWLERLRASLSLSLWVPLLPLRIEVSDTNLQRLQGSGAVSTSLEDDGGDRKTDRRSQSCRPLYQRARVRFLAYFVAHSLDGSRQLTYLLGTDWLLDVSPLIRSQAVIRDPHIARLEEEGSVLIGQEPGVTSVEVRSPVSHSILGEQTVLVSSETVSVLELRSNLMWGVNLSITPSEIKHPGVFSVLCQSKNLEMIPKQESALSLWFLFSDMSTAPITIYDPLDLTVMVVSSDPSVLSVRRSLMSGNSWSLPVLVFENAGQSPLLRFSVLLPERCQEGESSGVLSAGYVRVTFPSNSTEDGEHQSSDIIQSDSDLITRDGEIISGANNVIPGNNDIIIRSDDIKPEDEDSISGADDIVTTRWGIPGLEEGLYGLLAIFSLLTLLFFLSCVAFIMRHRNKSPPEGPGNPEAPNWVWLEGSEVDGQRNQGGGNVREEEDENEQWEERERDPQSLTSTFHPVRSSQDPETSIFPQSDACSFPKPTSLSRALLEAKRPEVMSFKTATTHGGEKKGDRVADDPFVRSILVASEEDIMWVCKDMGMREPQEILSYMERIRGETPPQSDRRREGPRGRGMEVTGASVRRLT